MCFGRVFERDGIKLVVDNISYDFVKGATVDYVEELSSHSFLHRYYNTELHHNFSMVVNRK